jgi:chemotaxis signal transduction protein
MTEPASGTSTAAAMRRAFDRAFAAPPPPAAEELESLLAIRVLGDPYAIRIREISGVAINRKIVALPGPVPELLGVAGFRGGLLPVYSLAALLGYHQEADAIRWLALCGSEEPVGLAFGVLEAYLRIPLGQVSAADRREVKREHVKDVARTADGARPVVSIPSLLDAVQRRSATADAFKEQ